MSAKKLASLGGRVPFSSITGKRKAVKRERPELFRNYRRDTNFLDARSYVTKGGRVRLFGLDKQVLRDQAFYRSMGRGNVPLCECNCGRTAYGNDYTPMRDRGELSHNEHGARKSDELSRVKWMRHECHMKSHNCNGKPITVRKKDINGNNNSARTNTGN